MTAENIFVKEKGLYICNGAGLKYKQQKNPTITIDKVGILQSLLN